MRFKLGIIVPSWNTMMEYETQRMACEGTSIHSMRIAHTADTELHLPGTSHGALGFEHVLPGVLHPEARDLEACP